MTQAERMNSASNRWEADPWDASDEVAEVQLAGFHERLARAIDWTSILEVDRSFSGVDVQTLRGADVQFCATHDGEDMLLMQLFWHGFPDPPEWRLMTRPTESRSQWMSWGYFADLPENWRFPSGTR